MLVGVIGAGVMGTGLAQDLTAHGLDVVLVDNNESALQEAPDRIDTYARMSRLLGRGADETTEPGTLTLTQRIQDLAEADFVIENVTEDTSVKDAVYASLNSVVQRETPLAVNTSAIPITRIGSLVANPARVVGMHFMNPVPLKKTVEIIRGRHTADETIGRARDLLERLGKKGVVVQDSPGFVSNRVLMLTVNEAVYLVHEGVAKPRDVDAIFTSCFGHPMGPLETADMIGLDTILQSVEVLYEEFADSKYRPCPLLKRMVEAGLHGRKSGEGFYTYSIPETPTI